MVEPCEPWEFTEYLSRETDYIENVSGIRDGSAEELRDDLGSLERTDIEVLRRISEGSDFQDLYGDGGVEGLGASLERLRRYELVRENYRDGEISIGTTFAGLMYVDHLSDYTGDVRND